MRSKMRLSMLDRIRRTAQEADTCVLLHVSQTLSVACAHTATTQSPEHFSRHVQDNLSSWPDLKETRKTHKSEEWAFRSELKMQLGFLCGLRELTGNSSERTLLCSWLPCRRRSALAAALPAAAGARGGRQRSGGVEQLARDWCRARFPTGNTGFLLKHSCRGHEVCTSARIHKTRHERSAEFDAASHSSDSQLHFLIQICTAGRSGCR